MKKNTKKTKLSSRFYLCLLNKISKKEVISLEEMAIIYSDNKSFIVNKKYEKLCNIIMTKYLKNENNNNISKYLFLLCLLSIISSFKSDKDNEYESYKESLLENIEVTANVSNIVSEHIIYLSENTNFYKIIDKEYEKIFKKTKKYFEMQRQAAYDSYLEEYSYYFNLDSNKVINLARLTTNNYESFVGIINNEDFDLNNAEASCMLFVYFLIRDELSISLEKLGITKEEFIISDEIRTLTYETTEDLILTNGDKYSVYLGKICDLFNVRDKCMMLSVSFSEIGEKGSKVSRQQNNFAGLTNLENELITYQSPEAGIIAMCGNFKKIYDNYTLDNINKLAGLYVKGSEKKSDSDTERWIKNVKSFYNQISENYFWYFGSHTETNDNVKTLSLIK